MNLSKIFFIRMALVILIGWTMTASATEETIYNRVSFNISAEEEIANDLLVVTLQARESGEKLSQLADEVNQTMAWALKEANRVKSIKAQTLNYSTSPRYEKSRQTGWTVSQTLKLSSIDDAALSDLMGKLQAKMQVQSAVYEVTPDKREAMMDKLTTEVLKKFTAKAQTISRDMQAQNFRIISINIGEQYSAPPRPMLSVARTMAADAVAAPAMQSGTQTIKVNASAVIQLQP